jgi:acetyl-CoA C-acetyltransferase
MPQISATDPIVILSYARTPMGAMQGALAGADATLLGATAVKGAVERAGVPGEAIDRAYMGCVLPAGLGQAPARQAVIKAGLPKSVQATTVNKVCGSGMQTVIMAAEALAAGSIDIVAGGMESMTNAPYLLKKHRSGARIGHDVAYDHMFLDGLEDAYEGAAMGAFAQVTANDYGLTREGQDAFSIESLARAQAAVAEGRFKDEIVPVVIAGAAAMWWWTPTRPRQGPPRQDPQPEARLRQGWHDHRRLLLLDQRRRRRPGADPRQRGRGQGYAPVAVLKGVAAHAHDPKLFTTAPVGAVQKVLAAAGWSVADVDLFEINEALPALPCSPSTIWGWTMPSECERRRHGWATRSAARARAFSSR